MTEVAAGLRLDKWLWFARFCKTRTLASKLCGDGHVRIDGTPTKKPNATVRPGQVLTFVQHRHVRVIKILALAERRGPASEAQLLYEDLAPPTRETSMPGPDGRAPTRANGAGRPTKRDRRAVDKLRDILDDR
ncbi:MAG: RNA-binding S4 domain-containing protein [Pseudomonadota bacterium]